MAPLQLLVLRSPLRVCSAPISLQVPQPLLATRQKWEKETAVAVFFCSGHFRNSLARHGLSLSGKSYRRAEMGWLLRGRAPRKHISKHVDLLSCPQIGQEKKAVEREPEFSLWKATSRKYASFDVLWALGLQLGISEPRNMQVFNIGSWLPCWGSCIFGALHHHMLAFSSFTWISYHIMAVFHRVHLKSFICSSIYAFIHLIIHLFNKYGRNNYWVPIATMYCSNYVDTVVNKIDSFCSQVVCILLIQINNK